MIKTKIDITLVNETKGYRFSHFTEEIDDTTNLYKNLQREWGRCQSRVYRDTTTGTKPIGWYFVKRMQYDDDKETYLRGAWISLYTVETNEIDIDTL